MSVVRAALRRRSSRALVAVAVVGAAALVTACGGSSSPKKQQSAAVDRTPATVTIWSGFTDRELSILNRVLADFHRSHPWIKVKSVGGISDDKIVAAIRGNNAPDLALSFSTDNTGSFCGSGAWIDLKPYMTRDHVSATQFPKAVQFYTQFDGKRCALPVLADVYGLYYNQAMFDKAGIKSPPRTFSELTADAKKLTVRAPDGTIKVAGFDPMWAFYENAVAHYAPLFGAHWTNASGKSSLSSDPGWLELMNWQKGLVDWYGYDKLVRFNAGAGDEFSPSNAFETGKLAMMIDGEYRTAFLQAEHPGLRYGTAPMPVSDNHPELYGAGYVTGNIAGIPKDAKHPDQAWQLLRYLATDPHALAALSNGLKNVPTTTAALSASNLRPSPTFKPFLKIFANPATATNAITAAGAADQELFEQFLAKYQAGKVTNPQAGLASVDKQIDDQLANASGGQNVP